jgi:hypothetical protein
MFKRLVEFKFELCPAPFTQLLPDQGSSLDPIIWAFVDVSRSSSPGGVATGSPPSAWVSASSFAPVSKRLIPSSSPMARVCVCTLRH